MDEKPEQPIKPDVTEVIDKMKEQVDAIQKEVNKQKQKAWYQTPSTVISLVALLISCLFSLYGIVTQREKGNKEIAEKISKDVNRLIELRNIQIKQGHDLSGTINAERQGILVRILDNIPVVEKILDANSMLQVGNEMLLDGRYGNAKGLFLLSYRNCKADIQKMYACAYLAMVYLIPNPPTCRVDSFKYYKGEEFTIASAQAFDAKNFYRGACHRETAYAYYYYVNDIKTGNLYIDSAKTEFKRFYDLHPHEPKLHINFADSMYMAYNK